MRASGVLWSRRLDATEEESGYARQHDDEEANGDVASIHRCPR